MSIEIGDGGLGYIYLGDILIAGKGGESGWKPNANTLLYLPLKSDVNDASGNSITTTSSGITFTTVGGIQTAHDTTSGYVKATTDFITSSMTEQTISCWFYVTSAQTNKRRVITVLKKTNVYYAQIIIEANTNQIKVYNNNAWGGSGITVTANQWTNFVMTADSSTRKAYMNGSLVWSGATSSAWQPTSETTDLGNFIMGNHQSYNESLNGNMGDMIIEKVVWSASEISDYYNQTKGKYGL